MNARERMKLSLETTGLKEIPEPEKFMGFAIKSAKGENYSIAILCLISLADSLLARIEELEEKLKLLNAN